MEQQANSEIHIFSTWNMDMRQCFRSATRGKPTGFVNSGVFVIFYLMLLGVSRWFECFYGSRLLRRGETETQGAYMLTSIGSFPLFSRPAAQFPSATIYLSG